MASFSPELKTYRVTFEVTQWKASKDWKESLQSEDDALPLQELELEYAYLTVPGNAVIEDITPKPLRMGFYVIPGNEAVLRRSGRIDQGRVVWHFWTVKGWTPSALISGFTEDSMRNQLVFLGPLVVQEDFISNG